MANMPVFAFVTLAGLVGALLLIKPLNALMLGDRYAENLGVNILRVRNWLLIVTGLLTAITTAFCGPVAFIGLAVPHIARLLLTTDNHRQLLPATLLCGSVVALAYALYVCLCKLNCHSVVIYRQRRDICYVLTGYYDSCCMRSCVSGDPGKYHARTG